jgi:pimeloyl-ACP methyl ester carboxylesterase
MADSRSTTEIPPPLANPGPGLRILRRGLQALAKVSPRLAARVAVEIWFRPPHLDVRPELQQFLATGERSTIQVHGRPVAVWKWGQGPVVLLVHGWGGYGAQLQPFVEPLVNAGYQAIVFDAPAHGVSGPSHVGSNRATLFDFGYAIDEIGRSHKELAGIIAHSGGCTATALSIQSATFRAKSLVFISPMASAARYKNLFHRALGLDDDVLHEFNCYTEERFNFRWSDFEVPEMASRMKTPPLLVIHDRDDADTSWQEGQAIVAAWPDSILLTTEGLGHRRILKDPTAVERAVDFVRSQSAR